MKKNARETWRKRVLQKIEALANGKVNDAVKLAFLDGDIMEALDGMDLSAVAEFKRNGNGTVEVKLVDRLLVLEKLAKLIEDDRADGAELMAALTQGPEE